MPKESQCGSSEEDNVINEDDYQDELEPQCMMINTCTSEPTDSEVSEQASDFLEEESEGPEEKSDDES